MSAGAARVGIVVVSHSAPLAAAAVALASQMAGETPAPVEVAAGADGGGLGTDATAVAAALTDVAGRVDAAAPGAGVVVLMDLGSAVMSAELALELTGDLPVPVRLCPAPLVEGLVAATVLAGSGAGLDEVVAEALAATAAKAAAMAQEDPVAPGPHGSPEPGAAGAVVEVDVTLVNPHGLHARPAAALVAAVRGFEATVTLTRLPDGRSADARSISAVSALGAGQGAELRVSGRGPQAAAAVDAVAALVRDGFGEGTDEPAVASAPAVRNAGDGGVAVAGGDGVVGLPAASGVVGLPAASGLGLGRLWHVGEDLPALPEGPSPDAVGEARRLHRALAATRDEALAAAARPGPGAGIFQAHALLLEDAELTAPALAAVDGGTPAARAWHDATETVAARLDDLADEYQRARAADVRSLGRQVVRRLLGVPAALVSRAGVLVAQDLGPDDVTRLDPTLVTGVVTAAGSPTSHAAILARSLGIPMVVAAGPAVLDIAEGTVLAVDGDTGQVLLDPDQGTRERWRARQADAHEVRAAALSRASRPALTSDGVEVAVEANVRSVADAAAAVAAGADGVGLLRTELLFLDRADAPSEDEQVEVYTAVARAMAGRRVTIRTLDVGGDKPLPYVEQPVEANPFLGLRGLRLALSRPDLFQPQLRAIVRVARDHPLAVMVPMVTTVAEVQAARAALDQAAQSLGLDGPPPGLEFGIMVEVPAAALRAEHLAPLVDFLSIGTNDLTQYTLAAERGNAGVAALSDPLDPAVLRLIAAVGRAGEASGARVAVCGELAADPVAAGVLIGSGVRELSVAGRSVPAVKDAVRAVSVAQSRLTATAVLDLPSAAAVRDALS